MKNYPNLVWFKQVDKDDGNLVGGKGANLGEMYEAGFPVPNGFIITSPAYFYVLEHNNLRDKIKQHLDNVDVHDPHALTTVSNQVKKLILNAEIPHDLANEMILAYHELGDNPLVAVRSSATAEDLPGASFAGQQETYLNIRGDANVVNTIRMAWASLFEARAIFYRVQKGFDHFKVGIAVPVQKMVQSEIAGIMFTMNPINNDKTKIVIEAIWGLGEKIVQGAITPDHYEVDKRTYKIFHKELIEQRMQLIKSGTTNKEVSVPNHLQKQQKLTDDQIITLAKLGEKIHQHYFFPQDIEWALEDGHFYIVQTRPITTVEKIAAANQPVKDITKLTANLKKILSGDPASPGLVSGTVRLIKDPKDTTALKAGEIMVSPMTSPDFVPAMKKAAALITDKGGQTSHAAIVSRELGLPCVVGTVTATKVLKSGQVITVNAQTGDIFAGSLPAKILTSIKNTPVMHPKNSAAAQKTATKLYVNLADPDRVDEVAKQNVDGVGLLRAEFIMAQIGIHPKKAVEDNKSKMYIEALAAGLKKFTESFGDRPVVYRASDFKTNEYRHLPGGKIYEPEEENPMIGFRGAYRYVADPKVFELELEAIKTVRNKFGQKNLWLMIPFVRTPEELIKVKRLIAAAGLTRSSSFKLWMMVEIPSNVVLLEEFIKVGIDGISIGSNDLTMLVLGADRDNSELANIYDERHPAVTYFFKKAIRTANKLGITSSMCGQAPSRYPDLTQNLVDWGITSISVTPDMIDTTREIIYDAEKRKVR